MATLDVAGNTAVATLQGRRRLRHGLHCSSDAGRRGLRTAALLDVVVYTAVATLQGRRRLRHGLHCCSDAGRRGLRTAALLDVAGYTAAAATSDVAGYTAVAMLDVAIYVQRRRCKCRSTYSGDAGRCGYSGDAGDALNYHGEYGGNDTGNYLHNGTVAMRATTCTTA